MPVDHPALPPAPVRRTHLRTLNLALGFLLTLGLLLALRSSFDFSTLLS
jgi:hypothetical protein